MRQQQQSGFILLACKALLREFMAATHHEVQGVDYEWEEAVRRGRRYARLATLTRQQACAAANLYAAMVRLVNEWSLEETQSSEGQEVGEIVMGLHEALKHYLQQQAAT